MGYGDIAPTSWIGRAIACSVMFIGLVAMALPIGVIGTNFSDMYREAIAHSWTDIGRALKIDKMTEPDMIAFFNEMDEDGSGDLSIIELKKQFDKTGYAISRYIVLLKV